MGAAGVKALEKLANLPGAWIEPDDRLHLAAAADRAARMAEELEAIRERSALVHDALTDMRAEQLDQRGLVLSVAALIGFITLAGISVRNGILKVSHYINLMRTEGERFDHSMIVRGSLERLAPVLMTALVTSFALAPLLFEAERPGTEILHPVAVVIFSGLISSTLLDTFLTPAMFWLFGRTDSERLMSERRVQAF